MISPVKTQRCILLFSATYFGLKGHRQVEQNTKRIYNKYVCNRVLRRIFGPKRDRVTGEWRKLHNEELDDLYSSPNIVRVVKSRRMRWAGHVVRMEEGRGVHKVLVGKPEGKRP